MKPVCPAPQPDFCPDGTHSHSRHRVLSVISTVRFVLTCVYGVLLRVTTLVPGLVVMRVPHTLASCCPLGALRQQNERAGDYLWGPVGAGCRGHSRSAHREIAPGSPVPSSHQFLFPSANELPAFQPLILQVGLIRLEWGGG